MNINLENKNNIYSNMFNYKLLYKLLAEPITTEKPCGNSIEYDNNYLMLQTKLMPQQEVQYGDFVNKPNDKNWPEIENDCKQLLNTSKDISVLIWLIRSRTQRAGSKGFLEGLYALYKLLKAYPKDIHPQLVIENFHDPAVRANAIEALTDPEGLLQDLRNVILVSNTFFRLTLKDVDKAFTPSALPIKETESIKSQLLDLFDKKNESVIALIKANEILKKINEWCLENLKEDAPNLAPLNRLLDPFKISSSQDESDETKINPRKDELIEESNFKKESNHEFEATSSETLFSDTLISTFEKILPETASQDFVNLSEKNLIESTNVNHKNTINKELTAKEKREIAKNKIQQLMDWFEENEPSSPVGILLKQAHNLVGKNFSEVMNVIPAELLFNWTKDSQTE